MGESNLSTENILSGAEIENLFTDDSSNEQPPAAGENNAGENIENKENNSNGTTTEVDVDNLFDTNQSESVGSGKASEKENAVTQTGSSTSPLNYSSIALACKEDGIFPDLDDDAIKNVTDAESLRKLFEAQAKSLMDEKSKRVSEALEAGVENNVVRQYEGTLAYLDGISEQALIAESNDAATLRQQLIYQDFLNKGFSQERATKATRKSFEMKTDIEDAKEALISNKEFYANKYKTVIDEAKARDNEEVQKREEQLNGIKKFILEEKTLLGGLEVDKGLRQKIVDNITKPIHKDAEGNFYTALQKYEKENPAEFIKNIGIVYTLTDGFKNLDGLVKGKVRKEVSKGFKALEETINTTSRNSNGNLQFMSGLSEDKNSFWSSRALDV